MAGIYLHIPFCKQACSYCNFHFSTSPKTRNGFVSALLKEMALQDKYLSGERIESIYFGGGTPSLLQASEVQTIIEKIFYLHNVNPAAEITLEANPDDISLDRLKDWRQAGINRLSIGVQSFFQEDLAWMNRAHNTLQAEQCIALAQEMGFTNISIDLIYGTPTLDDGRWKMNLEKASSLAIPHLSCYALTVEPQTALYTMIRNRKINGPDPQRQAGQFMIMADWLENVGYEHYEISNFSRPGKRSRHNSSYWQGVKYLGLGPSAHSFDGLSRQWNISNNLRYLQSLELGRIPFEKESLTLRQRLNEYIMTSLRTMEGLDLDLVAERFGDTASKRIMDRSKSYLHGLLMENRKGNLVLTREGKLFADGISADLFFEEGDCPMLNPDGAETAFSDS